MWAPLWADHNIVFYTWGCHWWHHIFMRTLLFKLLSLSLGLGLRLRLAWRVTIYFRVHEHFRVYLHHTVAILCHLVPAVKHVTMSITLNSFRDIARLFVVIHTLNFLLSLTINCILKVFSYCCLFLWKSLQIKYWTMTWHKK